MLPRDYTPHDDIETLVTPYNASWEKELALNRLLQYDRHLEALRDIIESEHEFTLDILVDVAKSIAPNDGAETAAVILIRLFLELKPRWTEDGNTFLEIFRTVASLPDRSTLRVTNLNAVHEPVEAAVPALARVILRAISKCMELRRFVINRDTALNFEHGQKCQILQTVVAWLGVLAAGSALFRKEAIRLMTVDFASAVQWIMNNSQHDEGLKTSTLMLIWELGIVEALYPNDPVQLFDIYTNNVAPGGLQRLIYEAICFRKHQGASQRFRRRPVRGERHRMPVHMSSRIAEYAGRTGTDSLMDFYDDLNRSSSRMASHFSRKRVRGRQADEFPWILDQDFVADLGFDDFFESRAQTRQLPDFAFAVARSEPRHLHCMNPDHHTNVGRGPKRLRCHCDCT